jgi:alcohol dehydrogenase class IV
VLLTKQVTTEEVMSFNAKKITKRAQVLNEKFNFQTQEESVNDCRGGRCYNDVINVNHNIYLNEHGAELKENC